MPRPATKNKNDATTRLKIEICTLRIKQHLSTPEIARALNCSRQYVSRVLNSLSDGPEDFYGCPYPAFRSWANKGTESMAEIASAIGMTEEELRSVVITDGNQRMPADVAAKLSVYTGIDAKKLARNERPINPSTKPPEPKTGAFRRVKYPLVRQYLTERNITMTTLAQECGQPYPQVYRTVTSPLRNDPSQNPICRAIAEVIGEPAQTVFHL